MTLSFNDQFDTDFFSGTPSTTVVPDAYPCALDSHAYLICEDRQYPHIRQSVPITRANLTGSNELGENTLNPDAGWRRSQASWHRGAGQSRLDVSDSSRERYRASKGIDPWERWSLSLLNDTSRTRATVNNNLYLVRCGVTGYLADGNELYFSTDLLNWVPANIQNAEISTPILGLTSDGSRVFASVGPNGIHVTAASATTSSHYVDIPLSGNAYDCLEWLKSRLFAGAGPALYEIVTAGLPSAPTALFTHPIPGFRWVGFCDGQANVYAAGYSGDKSQVYRIGIKTDGSGLSAPVVAGELPDGEIVSSIGGYLGYVFIGSNRGVRIALPTSDGSLTIGPLIPTTDQVRCFEGQDQFMWFGWSNYDTSSTGLGRMSLAFLNENVPAWSSDLMASTQSAVVSVITFNDKRAFTVAGSGVYVETSNQVATGYLDTGLMSWDVGEPKIALTVGAKHASMTGTHLVSLAADSGNFQALGTMPLNGTLSARQVLAESFEIRHTFTSVAGVGPVLTRWTLTALPAPPQVLQIQVPIQLRDTETNLRNSVRKMDVAAEVAFLESLRDTRKVFIYQERGQSFSVTMTEGAWYDEDRTWNDRSGQGVFVATMTTVGL